MTRLGVCPAHGGTRFVVRAPRADGIALCLFAGEAWIVTPPGAHSAPPLTSIEPDFHAAGSILVGRLLDPIAVFT